MIDAYPHRTFCRSLPHRQLRKTKNPSHGQPQSSLPHRQLRNLSDIPKVNPVCSLPHRQLRNERFGQFIYNRTFTAAQAA